METIPNRLKVEGRKGGESFETKVRPTEQPPQEIEQYRREGQKLLDSYARFFATFSRDVSLRFKLSDGFYIKLKEGEVNLDTRWFAERGFTQKQILWAVMHELTHFIDLVEDPSGLMANFDYIEQKAKTTGQKILQKWQEAFGASDPDFVDSLKNPQPIDPNNPAKTMSAVEEAAYDIHHRFFNIADDIWVNNRVASKSPAYEPDQDGGQEIAKLYGEFLFPGLDYSKNPRHFQFSDSLIRNDTVKKEEVIVSDEVKEALNRKISFLGQEYTAREIIEQFIKPGGRRETKASQRHFVLKSTIEPIFEELLEKDLAEWQPQKPPPSQGGKSQGQEQGQNQRGQANPFGQDYRQFKENNPDQFSDQDMKNWGQNYQEEKNKEKERKAQESKEDKKSAEEKAQEAQEQIDKDWAAKHNLDYRLVLEFRKIQAEVEPYLGELSELWQKIIYGSARQRERGIEGHFKTGTELDIQEAIERWPQIEGGELEEVRVMKKMTIKENLVRQPELIRVRLVNDLSGSMNEQKRHILRQEKVLILSSLNEFSAYLNLTKPQTKSKLEVETEVWVFGNKGAAKIIKQQQRIIGEDDAQVEIVKVLGQLNEDLGGTYDDEALSGVANSLDEMERSKIEQKKIMEIVFETTDGGSSDTQASRSALDNLANLQVIARAFQVGKVSADETRNFNFVWNDNRDEGLGEVVGENIANLLPAITKALKKYLSNVKL